MLRSFYIFELYKIFFKRLEAPFSPQDRKLIHKAIYEGLLVNDPELEPNVALTKIEALSELIKEFIALNRMFIESERHDFFDNQILNFEYNILLEKNLPTLNDITIVYYLMTILYSSKIGLLTLERKLHDDVYGVSELALKKLLNKKANFELPNKLNKYFDGDEKLTHDVQKYSLEAKRLFERSSERYSAFTRFTAVLEQ